MGMFVLALASKPMAVTLPFLLLLLDYWPLQRIVGWINVSRRLSTPQQPVRRLLLEKLPLFALSAASSVVTVWAQKSGGAMRSLQLYPFAVRFANALHSYAIYLWRTLWPFGFAAYYPLAGTRLPFWKAALAASLLCAISVIAWRQRVVRPHLLVGWLWFVGTLVPVIGIIQVGDQAMADRYAYLPLIGVFVALIWCAADVFDLRRAGMGPRGGLAAFALAALCFVTWQQLGYWQNSVTIWSRTLKVTHNNLQVEKQLANALVVAGDTQQLLPHLINITRLDPNDVTDQTNLGSCYAALGRTQEAMQKFEEVVRLTDRIDLSPDDLKVRTSAFLNLGFAYALSRNYPKALTNFQGATAGNSAMVDQTIANFERSIAAAPTEGSYLNLSLLLQAKKMNSQAGSILKGAIEANPAYVNSRDLLNYLNTVPKIKEYSSGGGANLQHTS
jgi:tetratricopeptide (TPR) repeat protein